MSAVQGELRGRLQERSRRRRGVVSARAAALVVDISSPSLWRFDPRTARVDHWPLPKPPGSFALRKNGGFLFAFRNGFATLAEPGGALQWLEPRGSRSATSASTTARSIARAASGRARSIASSARRSGRLPGRAGSPRHRDGRGFTISNGIGWSPDDRTMYFTDTPSRRIYRYDFDPPPARSRTGACSSRPSRPRRPGRHDRRRGGLRLERAVRSLVRSIATRPTARSTAPSACRCSGRRPACSAGPTSRRCT